MCRCCNCFIPHSDSSYKEHGLIVAELLHELDIMKKEKALLETSNNKLSSEMKSYRELYERSTVSASHLQDRVSRLTQSGSHSLSLFGSSIQERHPSLLQPHLALLSRHLALLSLPEMPHSAHRTLHHRRSRFV